MKIHKLRLHAFLKRSHLEETDEWFKSNSDLRIGDQILQEMSWPMANQLKIWYKKDVSWMS